jgi:hypothetical protein
MNNLKELNGLLNKILETKIQDDNDFLLANGIGRKLMFHENSIVILLENTIDISSCITLTRTVLETFSVFYLLYIKGSVEEKRIRLKLWKIDALKARQNFDVSYDDLLPHEKIQIEKQIEDEKKQIEELKLEVRNDDYYKIFPDDYNKKLIKNAVWKFDVDKIEGYQKNYKIDMGIKSMVERSCIREIYLQDIYNFTSMHAHTNYISVLQSEQLERETFHLTKSHLEDLNSVLITYFISNYTELYNLRIENYCDGNHIYQTFKGRI